MKSLVACLLLLCTSSLAWAAQAASEPAPAIGIRVDARVEIASVMARLAGFEEYQVAGLADYDAAVDAHFAPFRGHPAIATLRDLRKTHGIAYAAPLELALAAEPGTWRPTITLQPRPDFLDARWDADAARTFLAAARDFERDTGAADFFAGQRALHAQAEAAFAASLGDRLDLDWYRAMAKTPVEFAIVPALLAGPHNFGMQQRGLDGRQRIFGLIGTPTHRAGETVSYPADAVLALLVHEFHHSFVNPWVDAHSATLLPASAGLFKAVEAQMEALAYGDPRIVLYESLVRAHTQRYLRRHDETAVLARAMAEDRNKGFTWVPELAEALDALERGPARDDAERAASVAALFDAWGRDGAARLLAERERLAAERAARDAAGPRIAHLSPAEGSRVAAGDVVLELRFDRAMAPALAIFGDVPEVTGKPEWSADRTTLRIPARLAAGARYRLHLNSEDALRIKAADGAPLPPTTWTFEATETAPR